MYTLETLKPLNTLFDREHRLEQSDVEMVNSSIERIESMRSVKPCPGDIIEHTDEYGIYSRNTHLEALDDGTGRLLINTCPYVPFVYRKDGEVGFFKTSGGPAAFIGAAALTYVGKREKMFK